jgi:hypothetical protein
MYLASFDVNVDILPYDRKTTVFSITDRKSNAENVSYQLFFANKMSLNSPPDIVFTPDFVLSRNKEFNYKIVSSDPDEDAVTYSDDSELFEINSITGMIAFTPSSTGVYDTTITATDNSGNSNSAKIRFTIQ